MEKPEVFRSVCVAPTHKKSLLTLVFLFPPLLFLSLRPCHSLGCVCVVCWERLGHPPCPGCCPQPPTNECLGGHPFPHAVSLPTTPISPHSPPFHTLFYPPTIPPCWHRMREKWRKKRMVSWLPFPPLQGSPLCPPATHGTPSPPLVSLVFLTQPPYFPSHLLFLPYPCSGGSSVVAERCASGPNRGPVYLRGPQFRERTHIM